MNLRNLQVDGGLREVVKAKSTEGAERPRIDQHERQYQRPLVRPKGYHSVFERRVEIVPVLWEFHAHRWSAARRGVSLVCVVVCGPRVGWWTGGIQDLVSCFVCGFLVGCHILDTLDPFREVEPLFQKTFS
jgi:hypothetical protein